MSVLSRLPAPALNLGRIRKAMLKMKQPSRNSADWKWDREMNVKASEWEWKVMTNTYLFYLVVVSAPFMLTTFYCSLFYGNAKLAPIPEGYEPSEEEYEKSPITRWFVRNGIWMTAQQKYECRMHDQWEMWNNSQRRALKAEVKRNMKNDGDYAGWYYEPYSASRTRAVGVLRDEFYSGRGTQ